MSKKKKIKVDIDLDAAIGKGSREQYLEENPHGYKSVTKVHKSKKKYSRKPKHKKNHD